MKVMVRKKRAVGPDDEIKTIARQVLKEAKKRAKFEMDCLMDYILQEAKVAARYAKQRPFYIS